MAGVVHIPWYATVFRGDRFEAALQQIAPLALRYGATEYSIYRVARRPVQVPADGDLRGQARTSTATGTARSSRSGARTTPSWYQVPVLYVWHDLVERAGTGAARAVTPARAEPS